MITDFFSHKIHSTDERWQEKIIELAFIFREFDGRPFDRDLIERRLLSISPRGSLAARDASKFRDEFSAYQSYLGLYRLELSGGIWYLFLSETAKKYLVREEPDIGAFLRLQLPLFQFPNGMGGVYRANTDHVHIQANTRDKTFEFVRDGIHLSPLRLIVSSLMADASLRNVPVDESSVEISEVFAIANDSSVNYAALPLLNLVERSLEKVRNGEIMAPRRFESRFHILEHSGLFTIDGSSIKMRCTYGDLDRNDVINKLSTIACIDKQFNGFDSVRTGDDLVDIVREGSWGRYFDGVISLNNATINTLVSEVLLEEGLQPATEQPAPAQIQFTPEVFRIRKRVENEPVRITVSRERELADPEITRIKRQRRNLAHKLLVEKLDSLLRDRGAEPEESVYIDLLAIIPEDGSFLFEVKGGGENLLDQIRKGVSQLYEYRFRYKDEIPNDINLCLVLPDRPSTIPWVIDYLCDDRGITICWFNSEDNLEFPDICASVMSNLLPV